MSNRISRWGARARLLQLAMMELARRNPFPDIGLWNLEWQRKPGYTGPMPNDIIHSRTPYTAKLTRAMNNCIVVVCKEAFKKRYPKSKIAVLSHRSATHEDRDFCSTPAYKALLAAEIKEGPIDNLFKG